MAADRGSDFAPPDWQSDREALIEEIVAGYIERLNLGEEIRPADVLSQHPDIASEVIDNLQSFMDFTLPIAEAAPLGKLGDYTLRRQIGRGGMGVVYDAWQGSLDRRVALKVLPAGVAVDARTSTRFLREAQIAARLSHPQIVPVFASGVEGTTPYYAMEFVEGRTLAEVIAVTRPEEIDVKRCFELAEKFAGVAEGLQHAHSQKVIHRDIKPSNLILDRDRRLRILDFGLARLEGQEALTLSGDFLGTPQYMSPEQARRRRIPVDHRTDIYSLGTTMYESLTLRPPFKGKDHQDTLSQIIEREPVEPRKRNPRVPKDLETIVLKCLRKETTHRYGTAEALAQDLRRFARGDAIEAKNEGGLERAVRWVNRRRRWIAGTGAVFLLVMVTLVVSLVQVSRAQKDSRTQRDAFRSLLYIADMRQAGNDLESGNLARLVNLVDRHRPSRGEDDLRGWEWYYLRSLLKSGPREHGVPNGASSVDGDPTSGRWASAGLDGSIRVWARAGSSWQQEREFSMGNAPARIVAWSPDGACLAALGNDLTLRIWKVNRDTEPLIVPALKEGGLALVVALAWSPDSSRIAYAAGAPYLGQGWLTVLNSADGSLLKAWQPQDTDAVSGLAWSPDGAYLAGAIRRAHEISIWNTATWSEERRVPVAGAVDWLWRLSWSQDGRKLAVSTMNGKVVVYAVPSFEQTAFLSSHIADVYAISWSPDGEQLASAGNDGFVRVWNLSQNSDVPVQFWGQGAAVDSLTWQTGGKELLWANADGRVWEWDLSQEVNRKIHGGFPAAWRPDGRAIACATVSQGRSIQIIDLISQEKLWGKDVEGPVDELSFSPDGRYLTAGTWAGSLLVWNLAKDLQVASLSATPHDRIGVWCMATWSPDGVLLATDDSEGILRIWNTESWALVREFQAHSRRVGAARWSPDGRWLATAIDPMFGTVSDWYVSSTCAGSDGMAVYSWGVDFYTGAVIIAGRGLQYVRAVRGGL